VKDQTESFFEKMKFACHMIAAIAITLVATQVVYEESDDVYEMYEPDYGSGEEIAQTTTIQVCQLTQ
jgi:hypothetical protein